MRKVIFIKTTEACQLNCLHCFTGGNTNARSFLDVDATLAWAKRLTSHFQSESFHFELHGGEPLLLDVDKLEQLIAGLRQSHQEVTVGCTSNLVFKISDRLLNLISSLDSFGTSWDLDLRFANTAQESLWRENVRLLRNAGIQMSLNISLSKAVTEMDQEKLLKDIKDWGFWRVMFDRITRNGNARSNGHIFPTNKQINDWYLKLHDASEKLGSRQWLTNASLESVYDKFEKRLNTSGTFCRSCEQQLLTVNADGTIAGCPNSAPEESYSDISQEIVELLNQPCRIDVIAKEATPTTGCLSCDVFEYCGGDCHRLAWDGDVCAAPKQLMQKLAGLQYSKSNHTSKRIIPIKGI